MLNKVEELLMMTMIHQIGIINIEMENYKQEILDWKF